MEIESANPEAQMASMLLASFDQDYFPEAIVVTLRTKKFSELSRDYIATTLIDELHAKTTL